MDESLLLRIDKLENEGKKKEEKVERMLIMLQSEKKTKDTRVESLLLRIEKLEGEKEK